MSVERGTRAAFLHWFADDAVSFTPAPVVGTAGIEAWPAEGPLLEWAPERAAVSRAGDLGYTTGPYRAEGPDGASSWGHYHSVWRADAEGVWRVALDIGGPHGPVAWPPGEVERPASPEAGSRDAGSLAEAERRYASDLLSSDRESVLEAFLAPDVRVYRPGQPPFADRDAVIRDQTSADEAAAWDAPLGVRVARSGDLGYAWGTGRLTRHGRETPASWARIWTTDEDGAWTVVLEVVLPHG